jgi:hypothetical protein
MAVAMLNEKQQVLELVESLPENTSYDDIMQTLSICHNDRRAGADIREDRYYDTETAKQRVRDYAK